MRKFCLFVLFLFFSFSFGQVTVTRSFSGSLVRDVETRCTNTDGCWLSTSAGVQCGFFPQNTAMCPLGTQFFGIANYGGRSGVCVSLAHGCTILSSSCFVDNGTGGSCTTVHGGCDTNKGMSLVGFGNWIQCVESGQCGHTVPVTISASGTITLSCPDDICERVPDLCPSSSSASESSSSSEFDSSSSSEEWDSSSSSEDWGSSSSSEEGDSSSSSEGEVSSSSSEEGASSSSSEDWVSSSSRAEDGDCYGSELEASYAFSTKLIQCQANGGDISEMKLAGRCITGSCRWVPFSSSSLGGAGSSSSFGGGGGEDVCVAARQFLQKTADASDDWVYIGKEVYGSQKARRPAPKFTSKFFDVLGRTYDRVMGRKKYYTRKPLPVGQEYEFAKEFEVWARIIKDSEGRDIHVFRKEDGLRKFRRDSSFYWDGYWEVFEFDDLARETRYRASSGVRSLRKYDDKERLTERYMMGENGDTLTSERYEWKNGRLVRMTANGVVRNYIYGKTLQDMVRVVPSDEGFNYHRGYNGTAGKIPEEGEPGYRIFARNPYGHVHFGKIEDDDELEEENELPDIYFAPKKSATTSSVNILGRSVGRGCIKKEDYVDDMPEPQCVRFEERDVLASLTKENAMFMLKYGYPCTEMGNSYGMSYRNLSLKLECKCNEFGKYQPYFTASTYGDKIEVYLNTVRYNSSKESWRECLWHYDDLKRSYIHETRHIKNGRIIADNLAKFALIITFDAKEKCEQYATKEKKVLEARWDMWLEKEQRHDNEYPKSPTYSGGRVPDVCN